MEVQLGLGIGTKGDSGWHGLFFKDNMLHGFLQQKWSTGREMYKGVWGQGHNSCSYCLVVTRQKIIRRIATSIRWKQFDRNKQANNLLTVAEQNRMKIFTP